MSLRTSESTISVENLSPGSWYSVVIYTIGRKQKLNHNGSAEMTFQTSESRLIFYGTLHTTVTPPLGSWYGKARIMHTLEFQSLRMIPTSYLALVDVHSVILRLFATYSAPVRPDDVRVMDVTTTSLEVDWEDNEGWSILSGHFSVSSVAIVTIML